MVKVKRAQIVNMCLNNGAEICFEYVKQKNGGDLERG